MVKKAYVKLMESEIRLGCQQKDNLGTSSLASRPFSSSLHKKAPSSKRPLQLQPSATSTLQPSSPSKPPKCSIPPKDTTTAPTIPSGSFSLPPPLDNPLPLPSNQIIGHGRYRQWKCAPKDDILAHIDDQIADISHLLISCNMLNCKIPGYDDITFGDRLWVKSENDLYRAGLALKPSLEKSPDGTIIHRGFPNSERIIMRAAARNSRSLLLADELMPPIEDERSYECGSSNSMASSDKSNIQGWRKVGFTIHPLPKRKPAVRRKWTELEKLQPKWGPRVANREAAERYRQERRAVAYIQANGNAAGCFRAEDGASSGGRVIIGEGKGKTGEMVAHSQNPTSKHNENSQDQCVKALEDIENAIASDSDSDCESGYGTAEENAIESDSESCNGSSNTLKPKNPPSNIPKRRRDSLSSRPALSRRRSKRSDNENGTALNSGMSPTSSRGVAKAKDSETEMGMLAKRRVVRFDV